MTYWEILVGVLGGAASALAAAAFLAKTLVHHLLGKDLERYKSALADENAKNIEAYKSTLKTQNDRELERIRHENAKELERTRVQLMERDLSARVEAARQEQMTEVVKKRIETYPALYRIISQYGRSWELSGKAWNYDWCNAFLTELLRNNDENGAFFSFDVYRRYGKLRNHLVGLREKLKDGGGASEEEIQALYHIIRGHPLPDGRPGPGLGSYIKNELGAEVPTFTSVLHPTKRP